MRTIGRAREHKNLCNLLFVPFLLLWSFNHVDSFFNAPTQSPLSTSTSISVSFLSNDPTVIPHNSHHLHNNNCQNNRVLPQQQQQQKQSRSLYSNQKEKPLTVLSAATPGKSYLKARAIGTGSATPSHKITNSDLESIAHLETSDEWIKTRTGISKRHVLHEEEKLKQLSALAAERAIESAGIDPLDVDLVVVATSSPDDLFGDATSVAHAIGATNAVAFDLTAACSGFLFGTVTAGQFLHSGGYKKAVIVGADALSRWVDWDDRNTCILFGDGAGAMVLESVENAETDAGILGFAMHSDGSDHQQLKLEFNENKGTEDARVVNGVNLSSGKYKVIEMNGREVYKFATRRVPEVIEEALQNADLKVDQIDWLLLHQANIRIMEVVADRLGIPIEKIITNLSDYGNTSAGSIPLALDEAVKSGKVKKGDIVACAGFGAGLSWGSAIIRWGGLGGF